MNAQESNLQGQGSEENKTTAAQDGLPEVKAEEAKTAEPAATDAKAPAMSQAADSGKTESPSESTPSPAPAVETGKEKKPDTSPYKVGQRIWGKVLRLTETQATIGLGENELDEGVLDLIHLRDEFGNLNISEGDEVQAYVIGTGATVKLAPSLYPPAAEVITKLKEAKEKGEVVRGRVTGVNKGGLDINVEGRRAFCPFSHIQIGRCEEPEVHINHILEFKVTELDEEKKRIVLSRRVILEEARQDKVKELRSTIKDGADFDGVVMRLQPFGAFVDIGGVEGLVHVSEISHDRLDHPGEVLKKGEKIRVKVLDVTPGKAGKDKIRLSMKALLADPWSTVGETFHEGDIISGMVMRIAEFGAFVKLHPGIEGLLHVSQYKPRDKADSAAPAPAATPAPTPTPPADAAKTEKTEGATTPPAPETPAKPDTAAAPATPAPVEDPNIPVVGKEITVKITRIESQRRRISLSLRDGDRPQRSQRKTEHDGSIGDVVEGVVRTVKPYGVFLDLPSLGNWVSGLLPGQETGFDRDVNLRKKFPEGEKVKVEIIDIDDTGRIRLSRRSQIEGGGDSGGWGERRGGGGSKQPQNVPTAPPSAGFNVLAEALKKAQERNKK